ncbi:MAG: hypothetical protein GY697_19080, partial [Desulfobacterales bacterium]|nr:hypothetical protein [Desulfobacterales bacterium]
EIDKAIPQSKALVPDRLSVIKAVCEFYGVGEGDLAVMRRGVRNEPRDAVIYLFRTVCGEPLMQIGQAFGMTQYSSVSSAVMRINKKKHNDHRFAKRLNYVMESAKKGQE